MIDIRQPYVLTEPDYHVHHYFNFGSFYTPVHSGFYNLQIFSIFTLKHNFSMNVTKSYPSDLLFYRFIKQGSLIQMYGSQQRQLNQGTLTVFNSDGIIRSQRNLNQIDSVMWVIGIKAKGLNRFDVLAQLSWNDDCIKVQKLHSKELQEENGMRIVLFEKDNGIRIGGKWYQVGKNCIALMQGKSCVLRNCDDCYVLLLKKI